MCITGDRGRRSCEVSVPIRCVHSACVLLCAGSVQTLQYLWGSQGGCPVVPTSSLFYMQCTSGTVYMAAGSLSRSLGSGLLGALPKEGGWVGGCNVVEIVKLVFLGCYESESQPHCPLYQVLFLPSLICVPSFCPCLSPYLWVCPGWKGSLWSPYGVVREWLALAVCQVF